MQPLKYFKKYVVQIMFFAVKQRKTQIFENQTFYTWKMDIWELFFISTDVGT